MNELNYTYIPYNSFNIARFKSSNNMLKHARYIPGKTDGMMLVSNNKKLVGYIAWEGDMIIALETISEYRNKGIGKLLLSSCPANNLTVSKLNKDAIKFYENLGWHCVGDLGRMLQYKRGEDMILKRKAFSLIKDKNNDGSIDFEDAKIQYSDWDKARIGYPGIAATGTLLGTGISAYGGYKAGESFMEKKIAKENIKKAKKNLIEEVNKQIKSGRLTKDQAKKALSNKEKLPELLKKYGNLDKIVKETSKSAKNRIKKSKVTGALLASSVPLLGGALLTANEENKNLKFKYGPRRVEVGYVKLVQKKKNK